MRKTALASAVILVIVIAIAFAGCSSKDASAAASGTGISPSGSSAGSSASAAPSAGGNCVAVDAAHSWSGKWDSYANSDRCLDERQRFYPPSENSPDPWNVPKQGAGNMHVPVTFTVNGCDVTGSMTTQNDYGTLVAPFGCPITLTGKIDKDNVLSGTWKAYCDIEFNNLNDKKDDSGVFTLWMEPGGTTFVGTFQGNDATINQYVAQDCPGANGNWVGKRA